MTKIFKSDADINIQYLEDCQQKNLTSVVQDYISYLLVHYLRPYYVDSRIYHQLSTIYRKYKIEFVKAPCYIMILFKNY